MDERAPDAEALCNMVKVFASEEIFKVAQHAIELHGGNGVMLDFGIEKLFRDAAVFLHMDATVDISRFKHRQIEQPAERHSQPPIRTGSRSSSRKPVSRANRLGSATSATMAREAAAPAQKCGPAPNAMLLAVSRVRSNRSACVKCASSRLAEPNIRNTRSSGAKSTPLTVAALAMRRGDMPIGDIQRANSSNTLSHVTLLSRTRANSAGCINSAQMQPAIALRGSFCPRW